MEATETHYEMQVKNTETGKIWNETMNFRTDRYPIPENDQEAIDTAKQIIDDFNSSLRPMEAARRLVTVQRVETKVIDLIEADLTS